VNAWARYGLIGLFALSGVLLYLLATATANTERFAQQYSLLVKLNAALAAVMLMAVAYLLLRLWRRYRAKQFGTVLMARLTLMFALMAIIPGTLIYTVSVQFLSRSIESWFNVRVDASLESGLTLARTTLDAMLQDVAGRTRLMAQELSNTPDTQVAALLSRMIDQTGLQEAAVFTASGRVIATGGLTTTRFAIDMPSREILADAARGRGYAGVENAAKSADKPALRMRVVAPITLRLLGTEPRVLQVIQAVPEPLTASAESVQSGYRDYQELSLSRQGLREIYAVTLTLTLLLALFGAVGTAFYLSNRLSAPLSLLAQGTEAVAAGDFTPRGEIASRDELGLLTQSFSRMTRQLDEARDSVRQREAQLEAAKSYLESILANLTAGVLVFDPDMRLATANQGAETILRLDAVAAQWQPLAALPGLEDFGARVAEAFAKHGDRVWQQQIELTQAGGKEGEERAVTLLVRGSRLQVAGGNGYIVVCDDISELVSAQRSAAWGEVARRLAHEIKNPLTPIQLSAERLQMKLEDKLDAADREILARGTGMIVSQVGAMKAMVDDFREYARTPPASLAPLDLNALTREVLGMYENSEVPVALKSAPDLPPVLGDSTQLRQVIHNLLQNAIDAVAGAPRRVVDVETARTPQGVALTVSDSGPGFAPKIMSRAFEPYITTKARGTGLGLAIVKRIVDDHQGTIEIGNAEAGGARVTVNLRTSTENA
jgi:nitrogen fixation/metabolism regulation signal transduction histidine kinase